MDTYMNMYFFLLSNVNISSIAVAVRLLMAIGKRKPSSDVLELTKGRSMC